MRTYEVVTHDPQRYAAVAVTVPMSDLGTTVPPLGQELFSWLTARQVAPGGPLFWKYDLIAMPERLDLEVGIAVADPVEGDEHVRTGELPAGSYLETIHIGHPDGLEQATADLLAYAETNGMRFDRTDSPDGERWLARLEYYLTDPAEQPDLDAWETRLSFKLAD